VREGVSHLVVMAVQLFSGRYTGADGTVNSTLH